MWAIRYNLKWEINSGPVRHICTAVATSHNFQGTVSKVDLTSTVEINIFFLINSLRH